MYKRQVLNYANALLKYGKDADGALQVLEVVREDSRVLFPMAIAYDMKGDWRKAEKLLEEAAARGCNRAKAFKAVRVLSLIHICHGAVSASFQKTLPSRGNLRTLRK